MLNKKTKTVHKRAASPAPQADRRVQRTRQILREALVALILNKGYDTITVQDILERANVGRSTFYSHYWDKEDLLLGLFEDFHATLEAARPTDLSDDGENLGQLLFQLGVSHHRLYKAMLGQRSGRLVYAHAQSFLADYFRDHLAPRWPAKATLPLEVAVQYHVGAFLALLVWWLDNDLPYPPEAMARMFQQLTRPGLATVLRPTI